MLLFGGSTGQFGTCLNDTWVLNNPTGNAAWTTLPAAAASPAARLYHTAVYDPTSTRMIVFGGKDCSQNNAYFNDVWAVTTGVHRVWNAGFVEPGPSRGHASGSARRPHRGL